MRITEALKPVTDMLAAVGMSLDTATYKDGKLHITLNTEAPKATGKPGSGPEYPPEGYRLIASAVPGTDAPSRELPGNGITWTDHQVFLAGFGWTDYRTVRRHLETMRGAKVIAIAVPIAPNPEPVRLTDQEKIVGWRGPSGFRLQTFKDKDCTCVVCKKTVKAGERLARWRSKFPEAFDGFTPGRNTDDDHSHAHVDCLYHLTTALLSKIPDGLSFDWKMVPRWLFLKRQKYDAQQSTP